jgi:fructan beta-fructosidase
MHWGHAESTDLVDWEEKPIALYPDSLGYIFSGSAVLDKDNTSGLGTASHPPLIAIFTHHDARRERIANNFQQQSIAYSLDNGATWVKYKGNPVLRNPGITDFRDPKVMWYAPEKKWIMTLATKDRISFYSAPDLKNWQLESEFGKDAGAHGGVWECPDLFPMQYEGRTLWVLIVNLNPGAPNGGSGTQYFLGNFNGHVFTPIDTLTRWIDHGPDEYAGVTWHNTGDRILFQGWMSNWDYANVLPTLSWRNAMTVPRQLQLKKARGKLFIASQPVDEISKRVGARSERRNIEMNPGQEIVPFTDALPNPSLIRLRLDKKASFSISFTSSGGDTLIIGYDRTAENYYIDRRKSGIVSFHPRFAAKNVASRISDKDAIELSIVLDVNAVEFFADDGLTTMTSLFFPLKELSALHMNAGEQLKIEQLSIDALKPMNGR